MGNPISPVLSDIVMEDLETQCISQLKEKPLFYFRYVDDILLCIHKEHIEETLHIFNNYDKNLQFTVEKLQNNSISFLDLKIIIKDHKIITDWYKKPTFSGRYLNYNSHHPITNKIAIIYCLIDKAIKLSDTSFHNTNISFIKSVLEKNDYPPEFVDFYIKKRLRYIKNHPHIQQKNKDKKNFICLPYVKEIEGFTKNFFKCLDTNVIFSTLNKLNSIIVLGKDKNKK